MLATKLRSYSLALLAFAVVAAPAWSDELYVNLGPEIRGEGGPVGEETSFPALRMASSSANTPAAGGLKIGTFRITRDVGPASVLIWRRMAQALPLPNVVIDLYRRDPAGALVLIQKVHLGQVVVSSIDQHSEPAASGLRFVEEIALNYASIDISSAAGQSGLGLRGVY